MLFLPYLKEDQNSIYVRLLNVLCQLPVLLLATFYATSNRAVRMHGNHTLLGLSIFRMKSVPRGGVLIQTIVSGNRMPYQEM